jgi:hypothetical protein
MELGAGMLHWGRFKTVGLRDTDAWVGVRFGLGWTCKGHTWDICNGYEYMYLWIRMERKYWAAKKTVL